MSLRVVLFFLFIGSIHAIPLAPQQNVTCDTMKTKLAQQLQITKVKTLYQSLAGHLASKCRDVLECEKDGQLSNSGKSKFSFLPEIEISDKLCQVLELLSGPVGECIDYIRDEYDATDVVKCVVSQKTSDSLKAPPSSMMSMFENVFSSGTCESLFHNCTRSIIKSDCGQEILDSIDNNTELLMSTHCIGAQIYTSLEVSAQENPKGMLQGLFLPNAPNLL